VFPVRYEPDLYILFTAVEIITFIGLTTSREEKTELLLHPPNHVDICYMCDTYT
jgi:hypothetical protein